VNLWEKRRECKRFLKKITFSGIFPKGRGGEKPSELLIYSWRPATEAGSVLGARFPVSPFFKRAGQVRCERNDVHVMEGAALHRKR